MLYGILNLSFWGYIIAGLILTHISVVSVTLYLHRCQTHRGLELHSSISHFFRFWLWLTTGTETKAWVAIHRKHHARCETEEDPHSPQVLGIKKVLLEGAELYRKEKKNQETLEHYGTGTPNDWLERNIYSPHSDKGIILMLLIDLVLFGIPGITLWAFQMIFMPLFAAGVINGIGHYWGYRNFECPDEARNIVPIGIFLGGEELHNNHHTYGTSAKFSIKWWEFDIGWVYIQILKFFGLAKVRRVAPKVKPVEGKQKIDVDTLKALISNRFQVMARYSQDVMIPAINQEKQKAGEKGRNLMKRAKALMVRERTLIDEKHKQRLAKLLEDRMSLNLVYQYRERLLDIWDKTTASQKELLDALQEWCRQAESTGVEALKDFANYMRSYAVKVAC